MDGLYTLAERLADLGVIPDLYRHAFMVRGVLAALVVGPLLALVGTVIVAKRLVFFTQTIGHASLTGVALGLFFGEPIDATYGGLFGFCLMAALLMLYLRNRLQAASDTVVGVILAQILGLGIIAVVVVTREYNVHQIEAALFGSLVALTDADLLVLAVAGGLTLPILVLAYNPVMRATLNPSLARARGDRPAVMDYLFVVIATFAIVASLKLVGALLVLVLVVIPAATARNLTQSLARHAWFSAAIGAVSALGGLALSGAFPIPTGAAIVVAASALFYLSALVRLLRGT